MPTLTYLTSQLSSIVDTIQIARLRQRPTVSEYESAFFSRILASMTTLLG
jgi:hypothetical protein